MEALISNTYGIISLCVLAVILLLHVPAVYLNGRVGTYLSYFNIFLHTVMLFLLLIGGAKLEMCTLAFMLSLAVYAALSLIEYQLRGRYEGEKSSEISEGDEKL